MVVGLIIVVQGFVIFVPGLIKQNSSRYDVVLEQRCTQGFPPDLFFPGIRKAYTWNSDLRFSKSPSK